MIRSLIVKYGFILLLAFVIGVCTGLPQLLAITAMDTEWTGIYPTNNDDEIYYLARSQEIRDGYHTIAQPYLAEGKDGQTLQFWLPDFIVAQTGLLLSISPPATFILFDFILPGLLFLLTYILAYQVLNQQRSYALLYALLFNVVLFFDWFSRPISPQFTFIPLLIFLIGVWFTMTRSSWRWVLLAGLSFGVLFHFYTYYWTFAVVTLGLLGMVQLIQKEMKQLTQTIIIFALGSLIGIPYFIHLLTITRLPEYADTMWRLGMLNTHFPSGLVVITLGGTLLVLMGMIIWRQKTITPQQQFIGVLVLAALVVMNHHVITGKNLEFSNHYLIPGMVGILLAGVYLISCQWVKRSLPIQCAKITAGLLGMVSVFAVVTVVDFFLTQSQPQFEFVAHQRFGSTLSYLNQSLAAGRIIFANTEISALIPAYSAHNVFYAREANLHFMGNQEVRKRFLLQHILEQEFTQVDLLAKERSVFGTHYINQAGHFSQRNRLYDLLSIEPIHYERYPSEDITQLLQQWQEMRSVDTREILLTYGVTHVVWDTRTDPDWEIARLGELTLLHEQQGVRLYELLGSVTPSS